ncbi:MAG: hypothetical protein Kow0037_07450 [Calditrichia bacterium]
MNKTLLVVSLIILISVPGWSQSGWDIIQQPDEPLLYSLDNYFFLTPSEGWVVGSAGSSYPGVILHTTDGGATWEVQVNIPAGSDTSFYGVKFLDNQTGWVFGGSGLIWKTTDGGQTWTNQSLTFTTNRLRSISIVDANTVYASGDDGTIAKTTDGGNTWVDQTQSAISTSDLYGIYAFNAQEAVVISGSNDGVYAYTSDGGGTWNVGNLPFPGTGVSQRTYGIAGKPDGTAYAFGYHGTVFKTTDKGQNWTNVADIFPGLYKIFYSGATYNDVVLAGGSDGKLFRSSDAGATWDTLSFPSTNSINYVKIFDVNHYFVASNHAQAFFTTDAGQNWTPITNWPNVTFYAMHNSSSAKIAAVSITGGEVTISNDGGQNWSYPLKPVPDAMGDLLDVFFVNDNLGFYAGRNAQIGKTTDGGQTWALKPNSQMIYGNTKSYYFIYFLDENKGFAGGSSGIVQTTTDGGENWTEGSVGTTATLYGINFLDANTGIIAASSGRIYRTIDGGASWTEVQDFGSMTMRDVAVLDANTAVICASSGYVYKTTDAGATWTEVTQLANVNAPGDDPDLYAIEFVDATTGYICGEDGALYKSTDAGDTWTQLSVPTGMEGWIFEGMTFVDTNMGFIGTQNGYILGMGVNGITGIVNTPQDFALGQNYPNPFNPETVIPYHLPAQLNTEITIYNTLGQVVRHIDMGMQSPGEHQYIWNGKNDFGLNSPSGIYFYKIKAGKYQQIKKMTLMR